MCLVASTGSAQTGLRSASLAESQFQSDIRPHHADVFLATPDTYAPRRERSPRPRRPFAGGGSPFIGSNQWLTSAPEPAHTGPNIYVVFLQPPAAEVPRDEPRAVEKPPSIVAPPPAPGPPKTFYVIPGCYAGDKPPSRDRLPASCDITKLRIIPPVVSSIALSR